MKILRPEHLTDFPDIRALTPEEVAQAYALARAAFSAEDLQRYTVEEDGIPFEDILKELEEAQKQHDARPR